MSDGAVVADRGTTTVRDDSPDVASQRSEPKFQYPGIPTTCDGAEAVVHVEINVTQASGAFPITSSTTMGGGYNAAVMNGYKNLWGDTLHLRRAGKRALRGDLLRRLCRGGRSRHELHVRPRPGPDEGGALHDLRQAAAGGDEHRRAGADQPFAQRACRPRRRDERGRLSAGACSSAATPRRRAICA